MEPNPEDILADDSKPIFSDRTHKIADIAIKMMQLFPREARDRELQGFGFDQSFLDSEFETARLKAEALLDDIENRRGAVDAYQIFKEEIEYSAQEIADVFKEANWKGLVSKPPVEKLLRRLERKFDEEQETNYQSIPEESRELTEDILCALGEVSKMEGVAASFPEFPRLLNEFIDTLRTNKKRLTAMEAFGDLDWMGGFKEWCFVVDRSSDPEERHYRAHEIFRYAAKRSWEAEKLVKDLAKIKGIPDPKIPRQRMDNFEKFAEHREICTDLERFAYSRCERRDDFGTGSG